MRAEAAEALGWAPADEVVAAYAERDAALEAADHVVLWFEHDLHDQLQLVQILDRLAAGRRGRRLEAVIVDRVPGRETFHGLGELEPEELADLWPDRRPIDPAQLALGTARVGRAARPRPDGAGGAGPRGHADAAAARARAGAPAGGAARRGRRPRPQRAPAAARRRRRRPHARSTRSTPTRQQEEARYAGDTIVFARLEPASPPARTRSSPARPTASSS